VELDKDRAGEPRLFERVQIRPYARCGSSGLRFTNGLRTSSRNNKRKEPDQYGDVFHAVHTGTNIVLMVLLLVPLSVSGGARQKMTP
jgi:hypothetical protein